ncbi:hypothetical protein [Helicobacter muridarum]|nr:hypothetical protein [Helicobacter muridarum]
MFDNIETSKVAVLDSKEMREQRRVFGVLLESFFATVVVASFGSKFGD